MLFRIVLEPLCEAENKERPMLNRGQRLNEAMITRSPLLAPAHLWEFFHPPLHASQFVTTDGTGRPVILPETYCAPAVYCDDGGRDYFLVNNANEDTVELICVSGRPPLSLQTVSRQLIKAPLETPMSVVLTLNADGTYVEAIPYTPPPTDPEKK